MTRIAIATLLILSYRLHSSRAIAPSHLTLFTRSRPEWYGKRQKAEGRRFY
ncbi:MAG TPA: hypothetical protein V6D14_31040 [Coleofasciculaceae cyanobacterium]